MVKIVARLAKGLSGVRGSQVKKLSSFFFAQFLQSLSGIILLPFFAYQLQPTDFGRLSFLIIFSQVAGTIINFDFSVPLNFSFFNERYGSYTGIRSYLLKTQISFAILCFGFVLISSSFLHSQNIFYISALIISSINFSFRSLLLADSRLRNRFLQYNLILFLNSAFPLALGFCFLFFMNIEFRFICILYVVIPFTINSYFAVKLLSPSSKIDISGIFRICLKMLPHTIGILLLTFVDRIIISSKLGFHELATYQLAYTFANFGMVAVGILINAFGVDAYERIQRGDFEGFSKFKKMFLGTILLISISMSLMMSTLVELAPPKYELHKIFVLSQILNWSALPYAWYTVALILMQHKERFALISKLTAFSSVIIILATFLSANRWGLVGVAFVSTLGYVFQALLFSCASKEVDWKESRRQRIWSM